MLVTDMINILKAKDFNYTGSTFTEKEAIKNGHIQLSGKELFSRIINRTIFGDYPMGYTFVTKIHEDGTAIGTNNVGSLDTGIWKIDFEKNTLHLEWKNAWIDTITTAYNVNGNIEFYDIDTGKWRTTFKIFEKIKEE